MSSMLDQAIVDAKALKEAAIKSAESTIIEKYSQEIREAVDTMLGQEEVLAEEDVVGNIPMAASDVSDTESVGNEGGVLTLDLTGLENEIAKQLDGEEPVDPPTPEEMVDRYDVTDEESDDKEEDNLQENDEIDLTSLFEYEDEEINLDEEAISELAEKLTLDFEPEKSGWLGTPASQVDDAHEEYKALEAHAEEAEEEVGKLRESVETLEAEKKELQEKLSKITEHRNAHKSKSKST